MEWGGRKAEATARKKKEDRIRPRKKKKPHANKIAVIVRENIQKMTLSKWV